MIDIEVKEFQREFRKNLIHKKLQNNILNTYSNYVVAPTVQQCECTQFW